MSILKIEAFSGLSGDMFLGALAELTSAWDELRDLPAKLNLEKVEIRITDVIKAGIACKHVKILDHNEYPEQSHLLDQPLNPSPAAHTHFQFDPNDLQGKGHKQHSHHRHLADIQKIIEEGEISSNAKKIAKDIFLLLGQAEAKVHGMDINTIHFHEVGAIDSIMDIVGTAFLLDKLQVEKTYSTAVRTGFGFVMTEHGRLPVPCPATKELLLGVPTWAGEVRGEMTTPTGAAILKYLNPVFEMPVLIEEKTGHGPGEKNFEHPNVLRISVCKTEKKPEEEVFVIETNIDDMSPELLGKDFQEALFALGARDFYYSQVIMKKGRPGLVVSVLADKNNLDGITDFLFENTTTIGVRYFPVARRILEREVSTFQSSLGEVGIKKVKLPSGNYRTLPEYESCKQIAESMNIPVVKVYQRVQSELGQ